MSQDYNKEYQKYIEWCYSTLDSNKKAINKRGLLPFYKSTIEDIEEIFNILKNLTFILMDEESEIFIYFLDNFKKGYKILYVDNKCTEIEKEDYYFCYIFSWYRFMIDNLEAYYNNKSLYKIYCLKLNL